VDRRRVKPVDNANLVGPMDADAAEPFTHRVHRRGCQAAEKYLDATHDVELVVDGPDSPGRSASAPFSNLAPARQVQGVIATLRD
jgi:hypothetical protein